MNPYSTDTMIHMARLKLLREAAGLTQEELARQADISVKTVQAHEQGVAQGVNGKTVQAIASVLHVEPTSLFFTVPTDTSELATADAA